MSTLQISLGGQPFTLVSTPTIIERAAVQFDLSDAVALVTSEFTGQVQAQQWPGADLLSGMMTLPPLTLAQANDWMAFLMECRGMANAFLLGDPLRIRPTGVGTGNPFVDNTQNGGNPAGSQFLGTKGWTPNVKGILKRGDCLSTDWRLYYVLNDADSDGSGKALLSVWPSLREQPAQDGTFNGWQNASAALTLTAGFPTGNPGYFAAWSVFALIPGVELPADAVIQGIYPVLRVSLNFSAYSAASCGASYGPTLSTAFGLPSDSAPYTDAVVYGSSLGADLTLLNGQQMGMTVGATLENPFDTAFSSSGAGFAIYYTSAAPVVDATLPAPFTVPTGQGLAWAMPFQASFGRQVASGGAQGTAVATPASLNGQIGLTRPQGLFRLASNKRTWSGDPSMISRMSFPVQEYR